MFCVEGYFMERVKRKYSAEELLQLAYKHNQIPVVLFAKDKDCRYIYTSEIENLIDGGKDHSILGKTDMDIQYDQELGRLYYQQDKDIMRTGKTCRCYSEFIRNGEVVYREIVKNPVYVDGEVFGVCGIVSDVTELMKMKKKFESLAFLDNLTGLYNRNYFLKYDFDKIESLPCAYIMSDCNDLKEVNDRFGHAAGDRYIQETANLLNHYVTDTGICIRWGGDEILMIIPNCDQEQCREIIEEINEEQKSKRKKYPYMEIAVGYYVRENLMQPENEVIQLADQNMYADKKKRKMAEWK